MKHMKTKKCIILILFLSAIITPFEFLFASYQNSGESIYPEKIEDTRAVYFTKENFPIAGDGIGDDASALQSAIDLVREQSYRGLVFIPEGTYRLGKTIHLWQGIRLIGYGKTRPLFKLGMNTPGFQEGNRKYMVHFCHNRPDDEGYLQPGTWVTPDFQDGTFNTMYSGIDNINFEIGEGNPAAIAVRFHIAQVCALENIDFNIGNGRGAVEEMGNIIENCTFRGGEYGIKTSSSAPGWQCMVLDCTFEGQREASIITQSAKMLVIRGRFKNAPVGIFVPTSEILFVEDTWFEDINNSAVVCKNYTSETLQVNFVNLKLSNVPYSIRFSGRIQGVSENEVKMDYEAPAPLYEIKSFSQGLHIENSNGSAVKRYFGVEQDQLPMESPGRLKPKDMPALPSQNSWVNISDLGAKGDGITDDTEIFKKAISEYDAIYVPMGEYVVTKTLELREQTCLIGFHPYMTNLILKDGTPGFTDADNIKPLLVAPENGSNGISGIGFDLGINPGAVGIKWMAGSNSYIDDGLFRARGSRNPRGEGHAHSIWVTNGGGGIFKNLWIVDPRTKLAFLVSNTSTVGKIYEISVEHHKEMEIKLDNVENWSFYALQIEEDRGSEKTLGIYMKDCKNIHFANLRSHRTTGVWEPYHAAVQIRDSNNITIRGNLMGGAVFPWDNAVFDEITGMVVPHNLFTKLVIKHDE